MESNVASILLNGASADVELIWDKHGFAHVFAANVADAYRGMGYAAASRTLVADPPEYRLRSV